MARGREGKIGVDRGVLRYLEVGERERRGTEDIMSGISRWRLHSPKKPPAME